MNKQTAASVLILCQVFAADILRSQEAPVTASAPITLLPVKPGDPANFGFRTLRPGHVARAHPLSTVFLVTNQTSTTVVASLSAIEVKSGSNWITQMRPIGSLILSATNAVRMPGATNAFIPGLTTMELAPHQAAYSTINFSGLSTASGPALGAPGGIGMNYLSGQPTGAVWRLTVSVHEKLTGLAGASAHLTRYADMWRSLAAAGVNNAPLNPFSETYSYLGKPTSVSSEEVSSQ